MLIPRVNTDMLNLRPDQFCATINKVIDQLNAMSQKK